MSRQINQPINQVKLTNVAVVRCNKSGSRFEIACYRNKVIDYRSGLEKDLSEVLQTERIFTNVSKGQFAKSSDLKKAFGTTDEEEIAKVILADGKSIQVSDLERNQQIQNTLSQIASWIASNCVHPDHGRPYTVSQIKSALGKNFIVQTHKPLKKQCLDAVKFLKSVIRIERAKMELSIQYVKSHHDVVSEAIDRLDKKLVPEKTRSPSDDEDFCVIVLQVDPFLYRELDELAKSVNGRLEILQQVVFFEGDVDLDKEIERKQVHREEKNEDYRKLAVEDAVGAMDKLELDNEENEAVDVGEANAGNNDEDDEAGVSMVDRKTQKMASKRAKKAQRRKAHEKVHVEAAENGGNNNTECMATVADQSNNSETKEDKPSPPGSKSCNTCGGAFLSSADYRAHFKGNWHRFNQKLKLQKMPPVSEEEFNLCDAETFFGQHT